MTYIYESRFNRSICAYCRKTFAKEAPLQMFCSEDCFNQYHHMYANPECQYVCSRCGHKYKKRTNQTHKKICGNCKEALELENLRKERQKQNKSTIEAANERWLKGITRKGTPKLKRRFDSRRLEKAMEHKRVWDDKGWSHYLKGRKWDRI